MSNDNAFPYIDSTDDGQPYPGLTRRDYFAALAMQGLCQQTNWVASPTGMAKRAVQIADALIKVLEDNNEEN